ncbi:breast cancer type 1 susceptibility protein homolog isoform X2 [Orussus abietinus]|uniref:breast cancer type 1 susceptibility protein homolog isoform X2 n=1 Tax=Orussus abietinus TaxID=222816 RepID=UPI0006267DED|nr:breast cancer type 1 susceptibility protein homolog isoform X2 [Orussus abietinus]
MSVLPDLETLSVPAKTRCGHTFCHTCIMDAIKDPGALCPLCKSNLTRRSISRDKYTIKFIERFEELVHSIEIDSGLDITSYLKQGVRGIGYRSFETHATSITNECALKKTTTHENAVEEHVIEHPYSKRDCNKGNKEIIEDKKIPEVLKKHELIPLVSNPKEVVQNDKHKLIDTNVASPSYAKLMVKGKSNYSYTSPVKEKVMDWLKSTQEFRETVDDGEIAIIFEEKALSEGNGPFFVDKSLPVLDRTDVSAVEHKKTRVSIQSSPKKNSPSDKHSSICNETLYHKKSEHSEETTTKKSDSTLQMGNTLSHDQQKCAQNSSVENQDHPRTVNNTTVMSSSSTKQSWSRIAQFGKKMQDKKQKLKRLDVSVESKSCIPKLNVEPSRVLHENNDYNENTRLDKASEQSKIAIRNETTPLKSIICDDSLNVNTDLSPPILTPVYSNINESIVNQKNIFEDVNTCIKESQLPESPTNSQLENYSPKLKVSLSLYSPDQVKFRKKREANNCRPFMLNGTLSSGQALIQTASKNNSVNEIKMISPAVSEGSTRSRLALRIESDKERAIKENNSKIADVVKKGGTLLNLIENANKRRKVTFIKLSNMTPNHRRKRVKFWYLGPLRGKGTLKCFVTQETSVIREHQLETEGDVQTSSMHKINCINSSEAIGDTTQIEVGRNRVFETVSKPDCTVKQDKNLNLKQRHAKVLFPKEDSQLRLLSSESPAIESNSLSTNILTRIFNDTHTALNNEKDKTCTKCPNKEQNKIESLKIQESELTNTQIGDTSSSRRQRKRPCSVITEENISNKYFTYKSEENTLKKINMYSTSKAANKLESSEKNPDGNCDTITLSSNARSLESSTRRNLNFTEQEDSNSVMKEMRAVASTSKQMLKEVSAQEINENISRINTHRQSNVLKEKDFCSTKSEDDLVDRGKTFGSFEGSKKKYKRIVPLSNSETDSEINDVNVRQKHEATKNMTAKRYYTSDNGGNESGCSNNSLASNKTIKQVSKKKRTNSRSTSDDDGSDVRTILNDWCASLTSSQKEKNAKDKVVEQTNVHSGRLLRENGVNKSKQDTSLDSSQEVTGIDIDKYSLLNQAEICNIVGISPIARRSTTEYRDASKTLKNSYPVETEEQEVRKGLKENETSTVPFTSTSSSVSNMPAVSQSAQLRGNLSIDGSIVQDTEAIENSYEIVMDTEIEPPEDDSSNNQINLAQRVLGLEERKSQNASPNATYKVSGPKQIYPDVSLAPEGPMTETEKICIFPETVNLDEEEMSEAFCDSSQRSNECLSGKRSDFPRVAANVFSNFVSASPEKHSGTISCKVNHSKNVNNRQDRSLPSDSTPDSVLSKKKIKSTKDLHFTSTSNYNEVKKSAPEEWAQKPLGENLNFEEKDVINETPMEQDSLMNITQGQLYMRQFERDLFGNNKSDDERQNVLHKNGGSQEAIKTTTIDIVACTESEPTNISEHETMDYEIIETTPERKPKRYVTSDTSLRCPRRLDLSQANEISNRMNPVKDTAISTTVKESPSNEKFLEDMKPAHLVGERTFQPLQESTPKVTSRNRSFAGITSISSKEQNCKANVDQQVAKSKLCFACSQLSIAQIERVKSFAKLVNANFTNVYKPDVTHVIMNACTETNSVDKTLKYVQGIAHKKWVVGYTWITDCIKAEKLLNEEDYEVVDNSTLEAGPKKSRLREKDLFEGFAFFCIEPFDHIPIEEFEDLLINTGAYVAKTFNELAAIKNKLKVIVTQAYAHEKEIVERARKAKAVPLAYGWVIECISQYKLISLLPFIHELSVHDVLTLGLPEELLQEEESLITSE